MTAMLAKGPTPADTGQRELASVARGGVVNMVGAVISALTNLLLVVVVAHGVTPTRAGAFFALTSVFLVAETLCRLGADTSLIYFVSRWRALGRQQLIRPGLRTALLPAFAAAVTVAAALFVFAPRVADTVARGHVDHDTVALLRVLAVILPAAVLYDLVIGATRGFGRMRPTVVVDKIGRPVLQLGLVTAALVLGWKSSLGIAWSLPYLPALAVAAWMLVRIGVPKRAPRHRFSTQRQVDAQFWRFTGPRAVAGVAQILMQRLDIVLVAALAGLRAAAIYTAATRFVVVGQFVTSAISAPVQPRLAALLAVRDQAGAKVLYRASTTWMVLLTWPLFGACIALAPFYLAVFGHGYGDAVSVVVLLSVSMLVANACGLIDSVVIMAGRTSWNLGTTVLALVVNVGADLVLIPPYGITGAACGWCAGIVAANVVPLLLVWRGLGLHPFGRSLELAMALSAICFIVLPLVAGRLVGGSQLVAAGALVVGAGLFAAVVWRERGLFELHGLLGRRLRPVTA